MASLNLSNDQKRGVLILRKIALSEGDQLLGEAFHTIMNKREADISDLEMNLHTSSILFQKYSSYKCQFCTKVPAPSRLVTEDWVKWK